MKHMMRATKKLITFVALLLLPSSLALAVSATVSGALYEVEVLVFKNLLPDLEGNEMWTAPALADDPSGDGEMKTEVQDTVNEVYVTGNFPAENSRLSTAAEMLAAHSDYEILMHKKWVQNAEAKSTSKLLQIASGPQSETQLDGAIRFYVSRFFHLAVEIGLKELDAVFPATGDGGEAAQVYQILEDRRIKTEDINYFDHPKFGVLVQVNAVKARRK